MSMQEHFISEAQDMIRQAQSLLAEAQSLMQRLNIEKYPKHIQRKITESTCYTLGHGGTNDDPCLNPINPQRQINDLEMAKQWIGKFNKEAE